MPRSELGVLAALLLAAGVVQAGAPPLAVEDRLAAELAAAERTRAAVEARLAAREGNLEARVRVLYKLTRAGTTPLWVDERARADLVQRRAVARRLILRDLAERRLLVEELAAAEAAHRRLLGEARLFRLMVTPPTAPRSLARPVAGSVLERFGPYRDRGTRAALVRRGIELSTRAGEAVVAPAAGTVLYAGEVRGLGTSVLLDHGAGRVSVLGRLGSLQVTPSTWVERGTALGEPGQATIYLEIRRAGRAVDPEPLLARDSP